MYVVLDKFANLLKISTEVVNVLEWPALLSVEPFADNV